ncbi:MAG: hypothetical protein HY246_08860, partial [Proteobacteria bacterium]|nr:hypothetical protein [Pseudomonadota bacterium]
MTSPFAGVLVGSIIGVTGTPLVWVFVDKLFDPGPADDLESTLVQLAIAIAYWSFGWGCVTWRHRISVDETARSITWTKSVFGLRWRSETWHQPDMEAVTVERSGRFSSSAYAVGPRGRRPMLTDQLAVSDARWWAKALGVPYHDLRVRWAAPAKPEPPPTVSRLLRSLLLIAIVIPGLFWLKFGELGWDMGFGLAGFLAAIVLGIWYSDRH